MSLQLADGSETQPLGKLEDLPIKIKDIWVLEDFIMTDMTETDDAQIILNRPYLATSNCNIDVKVGHITFDVEGCYTMFCFMDEKVVSTNSSPSDTFPLSLEIDMEDGVNCQDPSDFEWISTKDLDQWYVKIEFTAPTKPSLPKVKVYASNESLVTDYCRFSQAVLSLPPTEGVKIDFDLGIEHDDSGQSDGPRNQFVLYTDSEL